MFGQRPFAMSNEPWMVQATGWDERTDTRHLVTGFGSVDSGVRFTHARGSWSRINAELELGTKKKWGSEGAVLLENT